MVTEFKKKTVKELVGNMKTYSVIGLVDLHKTPSKQLQAIRKELRGNAEIKMAKKTLLALAVKETGKKGLEKLLELNVNKPTMIFSNINPFKLYRLLEANQSPTYAKGGDVAPKNIVIPEGPTKLPAGPAIGELQRAKIPAVVKEGKIHVSKKTVIAKRGSTITPEVANVLKKLDIQPMTVGVNLVAAWEEGFVYGKDVLSVSTEEYISNLQQAHMNAINLAVNIGFVTKGVVEIMLQRAYREAMALQEKTKIETEVEGVKEAPPAEEKPKEKESEDGNQKVKNVEDEKKNEEV